MSRRRHCCSIGSWRYASNEAGGSAGGKQRTDSTHVLARVRSLSNLECVGETLRAVLDDLATLAPDWLVQQISEDWFERYSHRVENYRLPKAESPRAASAQQRVQQMGCSCCTRCCSRMPQPSCRRWPV